MPAKRARIMFTPSDRAYSAVHRVAKVTHKPAAAVVREQLEVLVEHMENLASVLEHAEQLIKHEPKAVAEVARAAYAQIIPSLMRNATHGDWSSHPDMFHLADQLGLFGDNSDDSESKSPPSSNTGATGLDTVPIRKAQNG